MKSNETLKNIRHSAAHLLAHAVQELYPETQLTIGPATDEGFFYDFLPQENLKAADLPILEHRMHEISKRNLPITHTQISKEEARKRYRNNPFKLELIEQIPEDTVGLAMQGKFYDLCKGGHVRSTSDIKHFTLLGISGSYWRADKSKQPLQRITGTAFKTALELQNFEKSREEALRYDHRKLGKQLNLFSFHEEGAGFPFFHPKGKTVLNILINYLRGLLKKADYQEIATPSMLSDDLWRQSGHYDHYKDSMFFSNVENKQYAIRPMNCPGAILLYKERPHSYRELPIRLSEFGTVHRFELSGVLHGLFRARSFTIDDGHIFCTKDQIEDEVVATITMIMTVFKKFDFKNIEIALSTKPDHAMGSDLLWNQATEALENALKQSQLPYTIFKGEGAFYGPKIEFHIKDSMGRKWQCGTIQLDFFLPDNFNLFYINSQGKKEQPVMIHRAIYGSLERFLAIVLEHYKGNFPFWIAPVQARILTITDAQKKYGLQILTLLQNIGVRAEIDNASDQISAKIKVAQLEKIPWMIIIGKKEEENNTVTIRYRDGTQDPGITQDQLLEKITKNQLN